MSTTVERADGFAPLSELLAAIRPDKLAEARRRVAMLDRDDLTNRYRKAFAAGQRAVAYLLAEALTAYGMPPCFRFGYPESTRRLTLNQRLDLFAHDMQWLAKHHPKQRSKVLGERYKHLFDEYCHPDEFGWLREAEYWFNKGERDVWVIVRGLQLSELQQWECKWLRSQFVTQKAGVLADRRDAVFTAIMAHLPTTRRTMAEESAKRVLMRRYRLWVCGQMSRHGEKISPSAVARLYEMWTGDRINRAIVAQQLEWVRTNIPILQNRGHRGARKLDMLVSTA